jgi:hypothetical protein
MEREQAIQRYAKAWFWEDILKKELLKMNLEFQEIMFIEEIIPYSHYIGFVKVKPVSNRNEFIEVTVLFDKRARVILSFRANIIYSFEEEIAGGKILLDHRV